MHEDVQHNSDTVCYVRGLCVKGWLATGKHRTKADAYDCYEGKHKSGATVGTDPAEPSDNRHMLQSALSKSGGRQGQSTHKHSATSLVPVIPALIMRARSTSRKQSRSVLMVATKVPHVYLHMPRAL